MTMSSLLPLKTMTWHKGISTMLKIITAAALAIGLTGCASYGISGLGYDCASEGRQKPIAFDNGVGTTWVAPNTARWCNPLGRTLNPQDDPIFINPHD